MSHKVVYFEGSISELLFKMYQAGLKLKEKTGEYYIFTTNYFLLPQDQFVVEEKDDYCMLQGTQACLEFLKERFDLRDFVEEYEVNNGNNSNTRKAYSPTSQASVIPIVKSNPERGPE